MKTIYLLEATDTLLGTDWCRPLSFVSMSGGMSDSYSFENQYNGSPENNARWVTADQVFPAWIGQPLHELLLRLERMGPRYEFVRGELPSEHTMLSKAQFLAAQESRDAAQDSQPLGFGKYKGKSPLELLKSAAGVTYLRWLVGETDKLSESMRLRLSNIPY